MHPRPIWLSLTFIVSTIAAGLAIRFVPLGLPRSVEKYGGSALWALMIYWIASTLLRRRPVRWALLLACAVATAVEFLKLYRVPWLDAFRLTGPGVLLLGRFFSPWDILAYWLAILSGAVLDTQIRRKNTTGLVSPV